MICVRSSHHYKKGVLRNFAKFTVKHLCQSLFFNKIAGLRSATLLKKRLWRRCFPVYFVEFLTTPFLQNTSGRLLLLCDGDCNTVIPFNTERLINMSTIRQTIFVKGMFFFFLSLFYIMWLAFNLYVVYWKWCRIAVCWTLYAGWPLKGHTFLNKPVA